MKKSWLLWLALLAAANAVQDATYGRYIAAVLDGLSACVMLSAHFFGWLTKKDGE